MTTVDRLRVFFLGGLGEEKERWGTITRVNFGGFLGNLNSNFFKMKTRKVRVRFFFFLRRRDQCWNFCSIPC